jgi:hypothetical protein
MTPAMLAPVTIPNWLQSKLTADTSGSGDAC